jgi:hypothetical protein
VTPLWRRFVSASSDETRKGEAITDAAATQSVMPQADGSDSIALQGDSSPTQFSWSREAQKFRVFRVFSG